MWSLGVILYILVTGFPPFNGKCDSEIVARVMSGQWDIAPLLEFNISEALIDLISRLLVFEPNQRYSAK